MHRYHSRLQLVLPGGRCCPAVQYNLHVVFPSVRSIVLTPSNLHEAMNVLPSLMMTVRTCFFLASSSIFGFFAPKPSAALSHWSSCT